MFRAVERPTRLHLNWGVYSSKYGSLPQISAVGDDSLFLYDGDKIRLKPLRDTTYRLRKVTKLLIQHGRDQQHSSSCDINCKLHLLANK